MNKGSYLSVVGVLELIASIISIVVLFVSLIITTAQGVPLISLNVSIGWAIFFNWLLFVVYCFFAPAVGVLFLTVGSHVSDIQALWAATKKNININPSKESSKLARGDKVRLIKGLKLSNGTTIEEGVTGIVEESEKEGKAKVLFTIESKVISVRVKNSNLAIMI